jgi:hypothetical protein
MKSHGQDPLAGLKLKEWVVDAGLEHIVTEETSHDFGKKKRTKQQNL